MKHLYLLNETSRAATYGIGTYIRQLGLCLANEEEISCNIIHLHTVEREFKTERSPEGFMIYYFPNEQYVSGDKTCSDRYYRNIWFLLSSYINIDNNSDELFFHLNYYQQYPLIKLIKAKYPFCHILYTVHYQNWSFLIKGNTSYFRNIINNYVKSKNRKKKGVVLQYKTDKRIYDKADYIICLSKYTQNLLLKDYHIPKNKMFLIYNGLKDEAISLSSVKKMKLKNQLFFSEREKIILFVGRLDDIKGVDVLIDAFRLLLKQMPDSHLVIIGDGDFSTYLNGSKDIWRKITFTGNLEKEDLYKFYQIADIGVMPSTNEQCSYVAIEMMMFGLPMVISTSTGLSEMLTGENAIYKVDVKERDDNVHISAVSLKNKIIKAISDEGYSARIRRQYENIYDLKHMKENYMKMLFSLEKQKVLKLND